MKDAQKKKEEEEEKLTTLKLVLSVPTVYGRIITRLL